MIREHDVVALATDLPEHSLEAGDTGTVIEVYGGAEAYEGEAEAYEIEFVTFAGDTLAVVTLPASAVREIGPREISHVRVIA